MSDTNGPPTIPGTRIDTATAVGAVVIGALLALAGLRVGFSGSVATNIGG